MALVTPWLLVEPNRFALMHGDYRLDNMLFDPDRSRITVVDWQTLGVGLPARDLAYFTATSLLPETRSAIDEELVEPYHRELLGYGVTDYDLASCWRDYRLGTLQAPLITALGCAFAISTERGDEMMLVMLERGCQAIRELEALDLLAKSRRPDEPPDPGGRLLDGGHRVHARRAAAGGPPSPPGRPARRRRPAWAASCRRRCSWSPGRRCRARAAKPARRRSGTDRATAATSCRRGSVCGSGAVTARIRNHASTSANAADAGSAGRQEHPRIARDAQRYPRPRRRSRPRSRRPRGQAGRASTRCGSRSSPHTCAAWAVMVAANGWVASTTASTRNRPASAASRRRRRTRRCAPSRPAAPDRAPGPPAS